MAKMEDYSATITDLCERALVTVVGDIGFWAGHLYLVGGLAPKYIVGSLPEDGIPHVGSNDVDLALVIAVDVVARKKYATLARRLRDRGFLQSPLPDDPEFRWRRNEGGVDIILEFLCETDSVLPGENFKPKSGTGAGFQACNIPGVGFASSDYVVVDIDAERLDDGGRSTVAVRVVGLLPFIVLKAMALQGRHEPKDAYDLVYVLLHYGDGPAAAGRAMASSPVVGQPMVSDALALLRGRFADSGTDGPAAYATFLGREADADGIARLRNEAVEAVRIAMAAFDLAVGSP